MSGIGLAGLLAGAGLGGGLALLVAAWRGWRPKPKQRGRRVGSVLAGMQKRTLAAIGAAVAVGLVTRWPVAAAAAAALVVLWPQFAGSAKDSKVQIAKLEGLVTWIEALRDSIAGAIGMTQAIEHAAELAPPAIEQPMRRLRGRLKAHWPVEEALAVFADEFDDGTADQVIAALINNAELAGPGLLRTLSALAKSGREELEMRRRVEEGRRSIRRDMTYIVGTTAVLVGLLVVMSPEFLEPYQTVVGQLMMLLIVIVYAAGLRWMRKVSQVSTPARFLSSAAGAVGGGR